MLYRRRRLHDGAALLARAQLQAVVELLHDGRELRRDVFQREVLLVEQVVALLTIPVEAILHPRAALYFHDESDGIRPALRRASRALAAQQTPHSPTVRRMN